MGDQENWISQGQKSSSRQALGTLRSSVTFNLSFPTLSLFLYLKNGRWGQCV